MRPLPGWLRAQEHAQITELEGTWKFFPSAAMRPESLGPSEEPANVQVESHCREQGAYICRCTPSIATYARAAIPMASYTGLSSRRARRLPVCTTEYKQ